MTRDYEGLKLQYLSVCLHDEGDIYRDCQCLSKESNIDAPMQNSLSSDDGKWKEVTNIIWV
jgi:hypothetical protein